MKNFFRKVKRNFRKSVKGAISILLSMVLLTTFSLGSLVMESGRYQSAKAQLNEANLSAALSMLSQYNETLSETYGLFGFSDKDVTLESYYDYLNFNSDLDEDYYGNNMSRLYGKPSAEIDTMYNLTNPAVLKRQLMEYSKYNIPLNTAAELLDVEEMMKKLKENIKDSVPGLDKMLEICNLINQLAEALEQLYQLEKSIAELDECYNADKSIMSYVKELENFIKGEESKDYTPAYVSAYDSFKTAVENKVNYMKENNAPANPGPAPYSQSAINTRLDSSNVAKKNLTNKIINILVKEYENTSVFGKSGKVEIKGDSSTSVTIMSGIISNFDNNAGDKEKLQEIIKYIAKENYGYDIKEWKAETLSTLKSKLASEPSDDLSSLNQSYTSAKSSYDSAVSANETWKAKKKAYDDYQEKIKKYNEEISSTGATYKTRCSDLKGLLAKYKGYLDKATGNLEKAADAVSKLNEGEKSQNSETFTNLKGTISSYVKQATNEGISKLDSDIIRVNALLDDLSKIDKNYSVTSNFTKHNIQQYYMSGIEAVGFVTLLNGIQAIDSTFTKAKTLFDNITNLVKLFSAVPYITDLDCNVTLSSQTVALLPSTTGPVNSGDDHSGDINELNTVLSEAKTMLNSGYDSHITKVDPTSRLEEADVVDEIGARLDSTIEALTYLSTKTGLLSATGLLFTVVFELQPLINHVTTLVDNMSYFVNNLSTTIEVITQSLYENTLLNSYILEKFPNRVSRDDKSYTGYEGLLGIVPTGETTTFKAACVEYVLSGKSSEILNQNSVFWKIFLVRMLNNIVCVLTNAEVMEIITACNVFAIIVFPLWVYLETNFDMNVLLMGDGGKVPLIKTTLILSPSGLEKMGTSLSNVVEDLENAEVSGKSEDMDKLYDGLNNRLGLITDELLEGHGLFPFSYDNYLWLMLFLTSNNQKVTRVADLIQMDLRYQQVYSKGTSATFLMSDMNTFIRVKASAKFNSILPIIAMNKGNINDYGIKVTSTKYVGY